jgi:hypothetical protein
MTTKDGVPRRKPRWGVSMTHVDGENNKTEQLRGSDETRIGMTFAP